MNRNVVRACLVGLLAGIALILLPTGAQAKTEVTSSETIKTVSAKGGFWIRATAWPSKYGDLSSIAGSIYGNRSLWVKIHKANLKSIPNPDLIRIGQRIYVPRLGNSSQTSRTSTSRRWVHPLPGVRVSSCYGWRWGTIHQGIDYDGNFGDRIRSVGAGTVKKIGWWAGGYGISVLVYHGGNIYSHYAHMRSSAVRIGQHVNPGTILGYVGATGHATGSHLHFEIWRGMWGQIDPRPWLRNHGLRPGC